MAVVTWLILEAHLSGLQWLSYEFHVCTPLLFRSNVTLLSVVLSGLLFLLAEFKPLGGLLPGETLVLLTFSSLSLCFSCRPASMNINNALASFWYTTQSFKHKSLLERVEPFENSTYRKTCVFFFFFHVVWPQVWCHCLAWHLAHLQVVSRNTTHGLWGNAKGFAGHTVRRLGGGSHAF